MSRIADIVKPRVTSLLQRGRKNVSKGISTDSESDALTRGAQISVDAGGWRLSVLSDQADRTDREASDRVVLPPGYRNKGELLRQVEAAFAAIEPEERRRLKWIDLAVSDPQIEVLDNRLIRAGMSDRESAAKLAREVLGRDESAFDVCAFGPDHPGQMERKVIAAVPLDRIRDYLSAAGDLAIRIRSIAPVAVDVISRATGQPECTTGSLEIGSRHTQIILAEGASGAIVQRVLPIGTLHFASKLAEAQSLSDDEALAMLADRDLISHLDLKGDETSTRMSRSDRALVSVAANLVRDIIQTIDDFAENRLADPPSALALSGSVDEMRGLRNWLSGQIGIAFETPVSVAHAPGLKAPLNLLRGTKDSLIVHGKTHYRFQDDAFVPDEDVRTATPQAKPAVEPGRKDKNGGQRKRGAKPEPDIQKRNRRASVGAAIVGALLGVFLINDMLLSPLLADTRRNSNALIATADRTTSLRTQLDALLASHERDLRTRDQVTNKILWTEKFLAISEAIPSGLWLTDTTIIQDERSVGATDVITTKLLIRGRTMLDDREHLSEVATFIQRLEADPRFMSDFRQITFEGMEPTDTGQVTFELHAWYDRNKRKQAAEAMASGENDGALDGLRRTTDSRNEVQENILNLGPRGQEQSR
ncbi:hypothetical protein [Minwuia sp.]|uniref:hypothetical protein n=1 Tax=Minwuia sp. TaxID=2493630 RepID=UPI003A91A0A6